MPLPVTGRPADEVAAALEALAVDDRDFAAGRVFGLVFHAGHEVEAVARRAHERYLWHNALNPDVFPSLRTMSAEVVEIAAWLLSGGAVDEGDDVRSGLAGFLTSGGTESILMAVKTAKVRGLEVGALRDGEHGNVVLPTTAHAAFSKGCEYFGLEERRVPVTADYRADPAAMADACDGATVLLVASAPQYHQGVIDPVASVAAVAADRGTSCHVDACMGGFTLPFMERAGLLDAARVPWDFRVPGVTTISADVHKYGYVPKGISVILHRDKASRRRQTFVTDGWLGGLYGSSGILGTKPGGPIAAGWAVLQHLGVDGFVEKVGLAVAARERMEAGVRAVEGLTVLGQPEATLLSIAADPSAAVRLDPFAIGTELFARGWHLDRQGPPDNLHATLTPIQGADDCAVIEAFLTELRSVVADVGAAVDADRSTNYASTE
jgi:sphinganine-1-phosphate aldolase